MVQAIKRDEAFIEPEGIHVETHQPERRSRKPPLVLVHGALTGSWLWTEIAAFLLQPTPVRAIVDTAAQGDVMPQKSTYFYPKLLTGMVFNPLED